MNKKHSTLFIYSLISIFLIIYLTNSLYFKLVIEILKINQSLATISSDFYDNPIKNVPYKNITYKNTNNTELKLDIYKENSFDPSPVILYVFGNGWTYGDKAIPSGIESIINLLKKQGYSVISTSYELMNNDIILEKQICDIKDTIRWIYKNKDVYNFDTTNIGIIAPSAGAQLSMVAAFSKEDEFVDDLTLSRYPSKVKYIIDLFGPAELDKLNFSEGPSNIVSTFTQDKIKELSFKYSPIMYLDNDLPDTLIIHSLKDNIVPYETSVKLYNEAIKYNNNFKFYTLDKCTHYLENLSNIDALDLYIEIINYIISETS